MMIYFSPTNLYLYRIVKEINKSFPQVGLNTKSMNRLGPCAPLKTKGARWALQTGAYKWVGNVTEIELTSPSDIPLDTGNDLLLFAYSQSPVTLGPVFTCDGSSCMEDPDKHFTMVVMNNKGEDSSTWSRSYFSESLRELLRTILGAQLEHDIQEIGMCFCKVNDCYLALLNDKHFTRKVVIPDCPLPPELPCVATWFWIKNERYKRNKRAFI